MPASFGLKASHFSLFFGYVFFVYRITSSFQPISYEFNSFSSYSILLRRIRFAMDVNDVIF
jgi:hypothetical protein